MWVRGLKQEVEEKPLPQRKSHPMWVRGLKLSTSMLQCVCIMSHPMWVRGLKHWKCGLYPACQSRTLCGCVDWNSWGRREHRFLRVAPYVGAWIETFIPGHHLSHSQVAPYVGAWIETGTLRLAVADVGVAPYVGAWIETIEFREGLFNETQSHPMWVRGLKHT